DGADLLAPAPLALGQDPGVQGRERAVAALRRHEALEGRGLELSGAQQDRGRLIPGLGGGHRRQLARGGLEPGGGSRAGEVERAARALAPERDERREDVDRTDVAFLGEDRLHGLAPGPTRNAATARAVLGPTAASISRGSAPRRPATEPKRRSRRRARTG